MSTPQISDFISYPNGNAIVIVQPNKIPILLCRDHL